MKHIVIAANPYRDSGLQKALTVYRMLTEHGHQVVVSPVFAPKAYLPENIPVQPLKQAAQDAALIMNVYQKNIRAIAFYQREGFEIQCSGFDESTKEKEYVMAWLKK